MYKSNAQKIRERNATLENDFPESTIRITRMKEEWLSSGWHDKYYVKSSCCNRGQWRLFSDITNTLKHYDPTGCSFCMADGREHNGSRDGVLSQHAQDVYDEVNKHKKSDYKVIGVAKDKGSRLTFLIRHGDCPVFLTNRDNVHKKYCPCKSQYPNEYILDETVKAETYDLQFIAYNGRFVRHKIGYAFDTDTRWKYLCRARLQYAVVQKKTGTIQQTVTWEQFMHLALRPWQKNYERLSDKSYGALGGRTECFDPNLGQDIIDIFWKMSVPLLNPTQVRAVLCAHQKVYCPEWYDIINDKYQDLAKKDFRFAGLKVEKKKRKAA